MIRTYTTNFMRDEQSVWTKMPMIMSWVEN